MIPAILTTKLYVPPPRPNLVARSHLLERLNAGISQGRRLILISAPAGFGKTTLLSEWLHQRGGEQAMPFAWVSLDADDNDPARFLAYLVAALRQISPHIGDDILSVLQSPQPLPLDSILTSLINELVTFPDSPGTLPPAAEHGFILILDDYHLIEAQPIHQALTFLLDHLPPQMHLIIVSRVDPPLPLARLRTRNQLVELRAAELRFTADEVDTFLNRTMGLELSGEEVKILAARTEGWIAGLQLAALSLQGRSAGQVVDFVTHFSGSHHYIIDYLAEEILVQQPEDIRDFLCQTSILDQLTAPLCEAVTGQKNSGAILRQLEQANLFLIPLDQERKWYRYHQLFADFLRSHLQQAIPDRLPELHRRASRWHEQEGFMPAAISHALAAADFARAAELIERVIEPTMMRGEIATVLGWLNLLPDEVMATHPLLCIYHALVLLYYGHPLKQAEARLQRAIETDTAGDFAGEIMVVSAFFAILQGDAHRTSELTHRALELLPAESSFFRTLILTSLGASALLSGDIAFAVRIFEETAREGQRTGNLLMSVAALFRLGVLAMIQGQYYKARKFVEQALELAVDDHGRLRPVGGLALICLGWLLYEWNELEAATRYLLEGIELAQKLSEIGGMPGYIFLALVKQAQGDVAGAGQAIQTARQQARKFDAADLDDIFVGAYQVFLWVAQGNLAAAQGWVEERGLAQEASLREFKQRVMENSLSYLQAMEYIALTRVYLAQKKFKESIEVLDLLLSRAEKAGWVWPMIEILIIQALAYHYQGSTNQALAALERALSLAEPGGYVRLFINEGRAMAGLLRQVAARGVMVDYVGKLLAAFKTEGQRSNSAGEPHSGAEGKNDLSSSLLSPYPAPRLIDPLSERELEVLQLVAAGMSNQEIAAALIVAPSTAKTHLKNIFRKLDVSSRTQALVRARELNLL